MWPVALSREAPGERGSMNDALHDIENPVVTPMELTPPAGGDWIGVSTNPLPVDAAWRWASLPGCGGIVTFCGTVRDHSEGRPGVTLLEYEAYVEQVAPRLTRVVDEAPKHWGMIGRLVLLHRIGRLEVAEVSVVVVASTPHRARPSLLHSSASTLSSTPFPSGSARHGAAALTRTLAPLRSTANHDQTPVR